jgi:hypothetical protein
LTLKQVALTVSNFDKDRLYVILSNNLSSGLKFPKLIEFEVSHHSRLDSTVVALPVIVDTINNQPSGRLTRLIELCLNT